MAGRQSRLIPYLRDSGELDNRNYITSNNLNSIIQQIETKINETKTEINNTNSNIYSVKEDITTTTNKFYESQDLLFSKSNVLFEEGFKSISKIQLCASIVIRIKQLIENNEYQYYFDKYYNYAETIRTELDNLFAEDPDLVTKVFIQSTYPGEQTFQFNNLVYDKYTNYSLNDFDNLDISRVSNIDKTIIGPLNTYATNYLAKYLQSNPNVTQFYSVTSLPKTIFNRIPQVAYFYFKYNSDKQIWTVMGAITNLPFNSIINDNNIAYSKFIEAINSYINNWSETSENAIDDNITTIIEYKSALSFASTKCLYSANYPEWTGDILPNLHKVNAQYDVVSEYTNTINSLWYNYPQLQENDIVVVSGFLGEEYYCNLIKIIKYNGVFAFIQQKIDIRLFYPFVTINNDIVINGSFTVKNSDGVNIIQTDNIKNVITFNDKIGVNQEIYNIKGLLDIDNLSNKSVDIIMSEFVQPLLNSYAITEQIKSAITFNGVQDANLASSLYSQYNFAILSTPILQSIEDGDIVFDHVEGDTSEIFKDFSRKRLTTDSFAKIKQIVTELYTMIYLENLPLYEDFILSFIENLSDGAGNFMCSMRAFVRYNETDNTYKLYFITTYLPIEKYYNNLSYRKELDVLINNYSQVNRFLNYCCILFKSPVINNNIKNGKTNDETNETFTGFINNSKYFRNRFGNSSLYCFVWYLPNDRMFVPLHEKYPFWENKPNIQNFIPNTDIPLQNAVEQLDYSYITRYGTRKTLYSFPVFYDFMSGPKISFVQLINFNGQNYYIGSGINVSDTLSESIITKGDNKMTGNLSIIDEKTGNNIFNVDTTKKQCYSMYNTGIGTIKPKTKLDIQDCGLSDAIQILNKLSKKFNQINFNIDRLKAYITANGTTNIKDFIENQFYEPTIDGTKGNNKIVQTKDEYYILTEAKWDANNNQLIDNVIYHYYFLYNNWTGKTVKEIVQTEIQNKTSAKLMLNGLLFANSNNMYYNSSFRLYYYPWINGIKINVAYFFTVGSKMYALKTGVDIQNNLTYETNKNIVYFLETLATHGNRMQSLVKSIINPSLIINETFSKINRDTRILNNPNGKLFRYVLDMQNKDNITVQELDINTYIPITPIQSFTSLNKSEEDFQLRNKLSMLGNKLKDFYSAYWGTGSNYGYKPFLAPGNYGIVHCEDDFFDYCSTFWLEKIDITSILGSRLLTFYSFELKLPEVLNPSLLVHGDTRLEGDLYIRDPEKDENFIFADANNRFLGINTSQVYGNYSNVYDTTTSVPLSKHSVYVRSHTYPNTVIERTAEKEILLENSAFEANGLTSYFYFKNFSTSTARRQSDYFTFQEMADNGKLCRNNQTSSIPNAFGLGKSNVYCYGADRNYEVKDKTGLVKEIGCLAMGIEKLEPITDVSNVVNATDARAAFSVNVVDRVSGTLNALERNILYCSNDSNLYINKVTTNGVQFGGHPDETPNLSKLLHLDASGNLMFGSKYIVLQDTPPNI